MGQWDTTTRKRRRRTRASGDDAVQRLADQALVATDAGLAGVAFIAPLFMGGRHDVGRFVFAALVAVTAVAWSVRQLALGQGYRRRTGAHVLFAGAAGVLLLQLVPLPADWLQRLAPLQHGLLAPWSATAEAFGLAPHNVASLSPEATRLSLAMVMSYALLFVTACQRLQSTADVQRLQRGLGLAAAAMAAIALLQYAAPNGMYLWVYSHPSRPAEGVCGAFANQNHLGHFLVLGAVGLGAWALQSLQQRTNAPASPAHHRQPLDSAYFVEQALAYAPAALLALAAGTVLLTGSRGAAVALAVAAVALAPAIWRSGQVRRAGVSSVFALAIGGALVAALIVPDATADRLATVVSGEVDEIDANEGRRKIWDANRQSIERGGALGAGAGAHREIYRVFLADPPLTEYTHAESSYLQIVTETGWAGAALIAAAVLLALSWVVRGNLLPAGRPDALLAAASAAAVLASLVHGVFDFVWHIPACLSLALLHAACLLRLLQLNRGELPDATADAHAVRSEANSAALRPAWHFAVLAALLATFSVAELLGPARAASHWDNYLRVSRSQRDAAAALLASGVPATPEDVATARRSQEAGLAAMLDDLAAVVRLRPRFADGHRQMANRSQQLFEVRQAQSDNPMPVSEIRNAAIASQFASSTQLLQWLHTAFGERVQLLLIADRHARAAVALSPLEGDAYLRLGDLAFLHGLQEDAVLAALEQAVRVRPYDGDVLLTAGAEWAASGAIDRAMDAWQRSFAIRGSHRRRIAQLVGGRMAPAAWIEWLQPGWDSLPVFWQTAAPLVDDQQRAVMIQYAQQCAERDCSDFTPELAAYAWRTLAVMQRESGQTDAAVVALRRAMDANPNDAVARRTLAMLLYESNQFDEAESHLAWCLARNPTDGNLQKHLKLIRKVRIAESMHAEPSTFRR